MSDFTGSKVRLFTNSDSTKNVSAENSDFYEEYIAQRSQTKAEDSSSDQDVSKSNSPESNDGNHVANDVKSVIDEEGKKEEEKTARQ